MALSDVGYLLNRATRQIRLGFASRLVEIGLRPQQAAALMAIGRSAGGALTPSQIADAIDADAPTVSGLLDRLVRDEWLVSTPNPDDGRSRLFALTEKAEGVLPSVLESAGAVTNEAMACFSPAEALELERLLIRLCQHCDGPADTQAAR